MMMMMMLNIQGNRHQHNLWTVVCLALLAHVQALEELKSSSLLNRIWNSLPQIPDPTIDEIIVNAAGSSVMSSPETAGKAISNDDNMMILEYDILMPQDQYQDIFNGDEQSDTNARRKRKAVFNESYVWDNQEVLIAIDKKSNFTSKELQNIHEAIKEWEEKTCIRFRSPSQFDIHIKKRPFVFIKTGTGCSSPIGKNPIVTNGTVKYQPLTLGKGCRVKSIVAHEIGHALGMVHEQSRFDRDEYLKIMWTNVQTSMRHNFQKFNKHVMSSRDVPYDYRSIMHYGPSAFSKNGSPTIQTKNTKYQDLIGKASRISFQDALVINILYKCKSSSKPIKNPR